MSARARLGFPILALAMTQEPALAADPLTPPSLLPYAARTAGEFAQLCSRGEASCADVIGETLMDKISFSPTSGLCLPSVDYTQNVAAWLRAHPETAKMATEDGIYLALKALYPCGGKTDY